jgi:GntR family transcriptional regulator, rspAB operon transcriptional repressor
MSVVAPDTRDGGAADGSFSPVVASIFTTLLSGIHEGRLLPGERISDGALAEQFQVSRTPVREAIQRLRDLGLVEASASRYTRVATVTPKQTAQAMIVWTALYGALVDEVAANVPTEVREAMAEDHAHYVAELPSLDFPAIATANFLFFGRLMALSTNPILTDGITRVVHLIRLGSLNLPHAIDISALSDAQEQLLRAVTVGDRRLGRQAIDNIRAIDIPLD